MIRITSPQNSVIKYVRSLERVRTRRSEQAYVAEGVRLVDEAIATGQSASIVLYDPNALSRTSAGLSLLESVPRWAAHGYEVDERVLRAAASTASPAGVLAVLRMPDCPPLATHSEVPLGLILDQLADPGNAGTILRTADAVGVGYVVALPGTVDLYSPKVVRAGMGAHFRLSMYVGTQWPEIDHELPDVSYVILEAGGAESIYRFVWPQHAAIVIGAEAKGVSADVEDRDAARVRIPMRPGVESLNASVAASMAMYAAIGPALDATNFGITRYKQASST